MLQRIKNAAEAVKEWFLMQAAAARAVNYGPEI